MYPVRKFNVAEAAYSTNLRLKMQEAEGMVRCIAPSRGRDGPRGIIKGGKQNGQRSYDEPRKAAGGGLL